MHAPTTHRHAPQAVLARHATVGVAGAKVVDEQRRIVHAGLDVALGEPAADQPCEPMSKPRGHRLRPAGSPEASVSARACSRLPQAEPSLGQPRPASASLRQPRPASASLGHSAAWGALAGRSYRPCFRHSFRARRAV